VYDNPPACTQTIGKSFVSPQGASQLNGRQQPSPPTPRRVHFKRNRIYMRVLPEQDKYNIRSKTQVALVGMQTTEVKKINVERRAFVRDTKHQDAIEAI
jgi:hypothetical protein